GRMRAVLQVNTKSRLDPSFFPEPYFLEHGSDNPVAFGNSREDQIGRLIDVAELPLWSFEQAREKIAAALAAEDPWERYWGCIVCSSFGEQAVEFVETARRLATSDEENLVRVRAAEFLGLIGVDDPRPVMQRAVADADSPTEANLILNTATLLQD